MTAKHNWSVKYSIHFHNFMEIVRHFSKHIKLQNEHRITFNDSNRPNHINHTSRALKWIMGTKYFIFHHHSLAAH